MAKLPDNLEGGPVLTGCDMVTPLIAGVCDDIKVMLLEKNATYGNSALSPIGVFAKNESALAQIRVRIDDKLNRIKKGSEYPGDDTVLDLIGYLVLYRVGQRMGLKG